MILRTGRFARALAVCAGLAVTGLTPAYAAAPKVEVTAVSKRPLTVGETFALRIDDGDQRRSEDKLTPQLWIEEAFAGTTASGRPTCEARALRLGRSGILDPATRDFNMMHVAALTGGGRAARPSSRLTDSLARSLKAPGLRPRGCGRRPMAA